MKHKEDVNMIFERAHVYLLHLGRENRPNETATMKRNGPIPKIGTYQMPKDHAASQVFRLRYPAVEENFHASLLYCRNSILNLYRNLRMSISFLPKALPKFAYRPWYPAHRMLASQYAHCPSDEITLLVKVDLHELCFNTEENQCIIMAQILTGIKPPAGVFRQIQQDPPPFAFLDPNCVETNGISQSSASTPSAASLQQEGLSNASWTSAEAVNRHHLMQYNICYSTTASPFAASSASGQYSSDVKQTSGCILPTEKKANRLSHCREAEFMH
ncbi:hypothetical protein M513_11371 [Trichuris suis]|uniref:Uncharacterized protein n=1 Tax=Trichuris suis TaxID=68888 RepID=A0A085LS13_9BILA|nr:hypothetical protein M513_11371 [Trichuris suis]